MRIVSAFIAIALCLGLPGWGWAQEAAQVPLPRERPSSAAPVPAPVEVAGPAAVPTGPSLPRERPDATAPADAVAPDAPADAVAPDAPPPAVPAEPAVEEPVAPPRDYQVACPAVLNGEVTASTLPPIHENMCGLQSPLSLEAVMANGRSVPLNAPVTTDCGIATALPGWVADVDRWLMATSNTTIAKVNVGTHYACRNVNNAKGGNLSFHAFGDALDVIGFTLEDGRTITVESAWPGTIEQGSRIIRFAHDAACTHFTTVLGPESNELHRDHLHLDLGCHGQRCMARLCE
jgi:hypothetical protein